MKFFDVEKRDNHPIVYLRREIWSRTPNKITGFKIFSAHSPKVRAWLLANRSVKKIILSRNPIDAYLSLLRAKATGQWVENIRRDHIPSPPLQFMPDEFRSIALNHVTYFTDLRAAAMERPEEFFSLCYEDVSDHDRVRQAAAFVGERKLEIPLVDRHKKQFRERYDEVVTNYAEMIGILTLPPRLNPD